ncbi:hypothetical protein CMK22_13050 [Candidatus Poribacteria bacterium]|nr:hypothetical protein [Candidatus Poribacteria bacterium]
MQVTPNSKMILLLLQYAQLRNVSRNMKTNKRFEMKFKTLLSIFFVLCLLKILGCESQEAKLARLDTELKKEQTRESRAKIITQLTSIEAHASSRTLLWALENRNYQEVHKEIIQSLGKVRPIGTKTVRSLVEKLDNPELRDDVAESLKQIGPRGWTPLIEQLADERKHDSAYYALSQIGKFATPELLKGLRKKEHNIRKSTTNLLQLIAKRGEFPKSSIQNLVQAFGNEINDEGQSTQEFQLLTSVLSTIGQSTVSSLETALNDNNIQVRVGAAIALSQTDKTGSTDLLIPILVEGLGNGFLASDAISQLVEIGQTALPELEEAFGSNEYFISQNAATALASTGNAGLSILTNSLKTSDLQKKEAAIAALGNLGQEAKSTIPQLLSMLNDSTLGENAAEALGKIGQDAAPELIKLLQKSKGNMRYQAIKALGWIESPSKKVIKALENIIKDPDVGIYAVWALSKLPWTIEGKKLSTGLPFAQSEQKTLDSWWVAEPFDNRKGIGFEKVYPPEKAINLQQEYLGKDGRRIKWYQSTGIGTSVFSSSGDDLTGYAVTYIESNQDRMEVLSLGSDDGVKVWVNGRLVWSNNGTGGIIPGEDIVLLPFKKGRNELLLKITNWIGDWGFLTSTGGDTISIDAKTFMGVLKKNITQNDNYDSEILSNTMKNLRHVPVPMLINLFKSVKNVQKRITITRMLANASFKKSGAGAGGTFATEATKLTVPLFLKTVNDANEPWIVREAVSDGLEGIASVENQPYPEASKAVEEFRKMGHTRSLVHSLRNQMNTIKLNNISKELVQIGTPAISLLVEEFNSPISVARGRASSILVKIGQDAVPALRTALRIGSEKEAYWARLTLEKIGT